MANDPIVFAMANPTPEIDPEVAAPYVRVMATGRSDYPNQINNLLCFPGIFKGADELSEHYIIPSVFNKHVVENVRLVVIEAAYETGVARRRYRDYRKK